MEEQLVQPAGARPGRPLPWSSMGTAGRGISGSTLKLIAIFTMLIDHIGAIVLARILIEKGMMTILMSGDLNAMVAWITENATLYYAYSIMRMIGRLGFPIFAFLLVEGFQRTGNVKRYVLRLGAFALISEIPFDLALSGQFMELSYQNVFFTLFIGLLTMVGFDAIEYKPWNKALKILLCGVVLAAGMTLAQILKTDYAAIGVACIMVLYIFRRKKVMQIAAGAVAFLWEITAPLAFIPIGFYNGKRGLKMKYVFYVFYPAHLLILYLISMAMGYTGSAM